MASLKLATPNFNTASFAKFPLNARPARQVSARAFSLVSDRSFCLNIFKPLNIRTLWEAVQDKVTAI